MKTPLFNKVEQLDDEINRLLELKNDAAFRPGLHEVKLLRDEYDESYPIPLFVVDELHHIGHLTEKSKSLSAFCSECYLEISPAQAEKLSARNGTLIRVESEVDKIVLPVKISEFIDNDVAVIPRNFSASPVNALQMRKRRIDRVRYTRVEEK